jgi:large subunit ribosomal protein L10
MSLCHRAVGGVVENPRPEKVAIVDEVRERLAASNAALITEYRGLTVAELKELRLALGDVGADYNIYKNTLVKLAISGGEHEALEPYLEGPTALTFVTADVSQVAKALREFAKTSPHLIIKGGFVDGHAVTTNQLSVLADLPPRDVLLAQLAGAIAAPMTGLAGLFQALPRSFAYGLAALVEQKQNAQTN